jgi:UDP-3-O-[3-hydroxymyristoyl] glucosamine N-acyltransferase
LVGSNVAVGVGVLVGSGVAVGLKVSVGSSVAVGDGAEQATSKIISRAQTTKAFALVTGGVFISVLPNFKDG